MAARISFSPFSVLSVSLLLLLRFTFSLTDEHAFDATKTTTSSVDTHTVKVSSLFGSDVCDRSPKGFNKGSSMEVVHNYGPCSQKMAGNGPSNTEFLRQDQLRVDSVQSRFTKNSGSGGASKEVKAALPAHSGAAIGLGTSNYVVTVGLGTPKKDLALIFDTANDFSWTQCEPCAKACYPQKGPKFDPTKSASYKNVSCSSSLCDLVRKPGEENCTSSTCLYGYSYGYDSHSYGFLATDTLTVGTSDVFKSFMFGCGQDNEGIYGSAAGLLALTTSPISFVSQTASKYNKFFSFCVPSSPSSVGHLTFGGKVPNNTKFTPSPKRESFFASNYLVDITAISVGGRKLDIDESVFTEAGTIIDSATVISRLQPTAHYKISEAFKEFMKDYPLTDGYSVYDTPCYDLTGYDTISVPKITFTFKGGVEVPIHPSGILFPVNGAEKVCLAFESNGDYDVIAILGSAQLRTHDVVLDGAKSRVGFAPGGCS